MCDPATILGVTMGLATGGASVAGQAQANDQNNKMIVDEQKNQQMQRTREHIVESNASNKEGNQAALERDRAKSLVAAFGKGQGSTAGLRVGEQSRQGALSIQASRDRKDASTYNYKTGTQFDAQRAGNRIAANKLNPLTSFMEIATSGAKGYGAFT